MEVSCVGLTKIYPNGKRALDGVDLNLGEGLFGLLGPNGAGKTTLMSIMTLLLEPTSGRYTMNGLDCRKAPNAIRAKLGYLPQFFGVFPELTAWEFLNYMASLRGLAWRERRKQVDRLLSQVRLQEARNKRLKTFSGGMLRRVGVAQALLGDPQLIVVDEPTAGLDPEERVNLRNLLFELGEGRVIVLSTHIVKDIEETCSRMALLMDGRIRYFGSPGAFVKAAEGFAWEFYGANEDMESLSGQPNLVGVREERGGLCFRVVSSASPREGAKLVQPNLEDAYVHFLGQHHQAA